MTSSGQGPLVQTVAYLFRRAGRDALSESELWRAMAFDLNWLPPKEARRLAESLARAGVVARQDDGRVAPTFDVSAVAVPLDFRPPQGIVDDLPREGNVLPPPAVSSPDQPAPPSSAPSIDAPLPGSPSGAESVAVASTGAKHMAPDAAVATVDAAIAEANENEPAPLAVLLDAVAEMSGLELGEWVQRMEATVQRCHDLVAPEAALLLAAAAEGLDVQPLVGPVQLAVGMSS